MDKTKIIFVFLFFILFWQIVEADWKKTSGPVSCLLSNTASLSSTLFPFDTVFINYAKLSGPFNTAPITVPRYGLSFVFYRYPGPTICPVWEYADFRLTGSSADTSNIKYPLDNSRLIDSYIDNTCTATILKIDTSYSTHEYRFKIDSSILYMEVLASAKPDSITVRFDTTSFLRKTQVINPARKYKPAPNSFLSSAKYLGKASKFYDIAGRIIQASSIMTRTRNGIIFIEYYDAKGKRFRKSMQ